MTVFYDIPT